MLGKWYYMALGSLKSVAGVVEKWIGGTWGIIVETQL